MTKADSKQQSVSDRLFNYLTEQARTRWGRGTSKAAAKRKAERERGNLFQAAGQVVQMSDRSYTVAKDGSLRRNWGVA